MGAAVSFKRSNSASVVHPDLGKDAISVAPRDSNKALSNPKPSTNGWNFEGLKRKASFLNRSISGTMQPRTTPSKAWAEQLRLDEILCISVESVKGCERLSSNEESYADDICTRERLARLESVDIDVICREASIMLSERIRQSLDLYKVELERTNKAASSKKSVVGVNGPKDLKAGEVKITTGNAKFAIPGGIEGVFGSIDMFHEGLDGRIGLPQPRVLEAMEKEHLHHPNAEEEFVTTNYGGTHTTLVQEWEFVMNPGLEKQYPGGRTPVPLDHFLEHDYAAKAGLRKEEIIALRLFTGPCYMHYNSELRRECHPDNRHFVTTIHSIVSGVNKLMKIWKLPDNRKIFRGLGGMRLPQCFWEEDESGCRGGVELSLMSCTPRKEVALQYASANDVKPTLFEIDVGQVDRGAVVSWLSQYPGEEEVLLPPLCNLEVQGRPRMEKSSDVGDILVVKLRLSVNFKNLTLEEVEAKRKVHHLSMIRSLEAEARRTILSQSESELHAFASAGIDLQSFFGDMVSMRQACSERPPEWYNDDDSFRKAVNEALDVKVGIERKFGSLLDLVQCINTKSQSKLCRIDDAGGLTSRIISTPVSAFCRAGIMYELRSSTSAIPWDALAEGKLIELIIPASVTSEQAEIVWECIIKKKETLQHIKIQAAGNTYCPVQLSSILGEQAHSLKGFAIGSSGFRALLPALSFNPQITELDLCSCEIENEGARYLAVLVDRQGMHLRSLNICHNRITDPGFNVVCDSLAKFSSLTFLHAGSNDLDKDSGPGLKKVLECHTSLTVLDLSWSRAAAGIPEFAPALKDLVGLKNLDFTNNDGTIGKEGCELLLNCLMPCNELEGFHVTTGKLGDEGVIKLSRFLATKPKMRVIPMVDWDCTSIGAFQAVQQMAGLKLALAKGRIGMNDDVMESWTQGIRNFPEKRLIGVNMGEFDLSDKVDQSRPYSQQSIASLFDLAPTDTDPNDRQAKSEPLNCRYKMWSARMYIAICLCQAWPSRQAYGSVFELGTMETLKDLTLTIMNFSRTPFHDHIATLRLSNSINRVSLVSCNLQAAGAKALAKAMRDMTQVEVIELSSNNIGPEGCRAITPVISANPGLKNLMMHFNDIRDEGFSCLVEAVRSCPKLSSLGFSFNNIHAGLVGNLKVILMSCPELMTLGLQGNPLGTQGVNALLESRNLIKHLKTLDFSLTGMSPFIARRIAERYGGTVSFLC